jgi:hypothetical protein
MGKIKATNFLKVTPPPKVTATFRFVVPVKYKAGTLKALDSIRNLFGKDGQNWITGSEQEEYEVGDEHPRTEETITKAFTGYCLVGGVHEVDGIYEELAQAAISLAIIKRTEIDLGLDELDADEVEYTVHDKIMDTSTIIDFNDSTATWNDIKAVLKLAKEIVKKAPVK